MNAVVPGFTYKMETASGRELFLKLTAYDPIYKRWLAEDAATENSKPTYVNLKEYSSIVPVRTCAVPKHRPLLAARVKNRRRAARRASNASTCLYIIGIGNNHYKVGCTDNIEQRMRQGKTWCSNMHLVAKKNIPRVHTGNWRLHERNVHEAVAQGSRCGHSKTGGTEVFRLTPHALERAKQFLRNMRFTT